MVKTNGDPTEIGKLVMQTQTLRTQAGEINKSYHDRAVAILDAGQQDQLLKMEEAIKLQPAIPQARALMLLGPSRGVWDRSRGCWQAEIPRARERYAVRNAGTAQSNSNLQIGFNLVN